MTDTLSPYIRSQALSTLFDRDIPELLLISTIEFQHISPGIFIHHQAWCCFHGFYSTFVAYVHTDMESFP
jgi:hypothetical protein